MGVDLTIYIRVECEVLPFKGDGGVPGGVVVGTGPIVDVKVDGVHIGTVALIGKVHNIISIDLNVRASARQSQETPPEINETAQALKNRPARFTHLPLQKLQNPSLRTHHRNSRIHCTDRDGAGRLQHYSQFCLLHPASGRLFEGVGCQ